MIDIGSVLKQSQITYESGNPVVFSIAFKKADGTTRIIEKARRFVKPVRATKEGGQTKSLYNLKKNNCILIWDELEQQSKSVKISRITKFNGQIVRH